MKYFFILQNNIQHRNIINKSGITGLSAAMRIECCVLQNQIKPVLPLHETADFGLPFLDICRFII
ncbi:hypothetical protein D3C76_1850880 [compost metagenome]